jgi:hypothetical protein
MISDPPSLAGALQARVALPLPAEADTSVGAAGTVAGWADRSVERGPSPTAFMALTW